MSPETFKNDGENLRSKGISWDVMVLDEAHKAKNTKTKLRKALKEFKVRGSKILLSGTPVQNNLLEFYSLVDLVQDNLFGTLSDFKTRFEQPISKGLQRFSRLAVKQHAMRQI